MIDALKKTLYAGIGATVVTAEKIESALQELGTPRFPGKGSRRTEEIEILSNS